MKNLPDTSVPIASFDFQDRLAVHLLTGTTSHMWNLNKYPEIGFATLVSHCGEASTCAAALLIR